MQLVDEYGQDNAHNEGGNQAEKANGMEWNRGVLGGLD